MKLIYILHKEINFSFC